ncbi:ROK family transcriptional regulator [Paenibacillus hunanensis]|uniref:ROK family transcriptional regulator n=1 Tax=Paenibacillus hunanensis TaxID=539262 RepID=UPI0020265931|nr:ROK family transcriptional regulator [Paenibacillus hunanensis]MCL9660909.1 ROK family transcriptional regulator [Paenibacillus hunanensis]WPP41167.1 ROK family transcriptional regulator [Paenibacillus hunanensis]
MAKQFKGMPSVKKAVYDRIAAQRDISKAEIMEQFQLTSSSLTRLLDELSREGWIMESGFGQSTGGRRPILYQINPGHRYIFGLDISRIYSVLGLYDMEMRPLELVRWNMDEQMTPQRLTQHVGEKVRELLERHRIPADHVLGLGVGAVGPLSREQGRILNPLYFAASGWNDVPLRQWLEEVTSLPVIVENGANTALIGEHWMVRSEHIRHMLYVHVGTGLRSAMLSNGQIVHGAVDMEGSIGQMIIQTDGPRLHGTGNYGALEAFASVQAVEQQVRARSKMNREHWGGGSLAIKPEAINFATIVQALESGNEYVREIFAQSAAYLGIGLANLINVLHPEQIILGGVMISAGDLFYNTAISVAEQNIYYSGSYHPEFSRGILQETAVSTGAAVMVWNEYEL